ncbi:Zn-dependent protease with chaperone function [Nocardia transvalensis]|uniref:Zn-dependent protease with chaperone function n=1 Tax=Nocardia transvalensis TaxID=37333 RepID=A0A7W9P9K0_9NOCA|nr:M48 family metalloprotease [Nocardia transvalensis]MBB5911698.1 Zn-dependent protease with chaperone function [Nocardia transvalensis]
MLLLAALPSAALMTVLLYGLGMAMGFTVPAALPVAWFLVCAAWGALSFLSAERRWVLWLSGLRAPDGDEFPRLSAAWGNVARQAGVPVTAYSLWVRKADRGGALPDRMIAVTPEAVRWLGPRELEAVLGHELGCRLRGRAAFGQFVFRHFNAPVVWVERTLMSGLLVVGDFFAQRMPVRASRGFLLGWTTISRLLAACPIIAMLTVIIGLPAAVLLRLVPELAALILVSLARRTEYRADRRVVDWGYGPDLCVVLRYRHVPESWTPAPDPMSVSAVVPEISPDDRIGRMRDRLDELARSAYR